MWVLLLVKLQTRGCNHTNPCVIGRPVAKIRSFLVVWWCGGAVGVDVRVRVFVFGLVCPVAVRAWQCGRGVRRAP